MTPEKAIKQTNKNGFCKLGHKSYLWLRSEAEKCIKFSTTKPYILVIGGNWSECFGVAGASDKRLIETLKGECLMSPQFN